MFLFSKIKENKNIILLILIILFGFCLRTWHLDKPGGLWFDEMQTWLEAKMSFTDFFQIFFIRHIHTPLFYFILHFWIKLFGEADLTLRILPLIFGVLAILAAYLCGKELKCNKTALLAAFFIAINSLLIYYSQELRFYSLIALFSSLITLFLLKVTNNPSKLNITGLALANAGLLYTHSISFVFVFFEFLFFGLYFLFKQKKSFKPLIYSGILVFILYIPLLFKMFRLINVKTSGITAQWWSKFTLDQILFVLGDSFSPFLIANQSPPGNYLDFVLQSQVFTAIFLVFVFIPLIIGIYGIITAVIKRPVNLLLLLTCVGFMAIFAVKAAEGRVVYVSRYLIEVTPVFLLLSAYGLSRIKNKFISNFLIGLVVSICLFFLIFTPVSASKQSRGLGIKPAADILNRYNFTDKDYFILIGGKKSHFHKYFKPSFSGSFFCLHNWNLHFIPFFLKNEFPLKYITEIGYYSTMNAKMPQKVIAGREYISNRLKETKLYKDYKKTNDYESYMYDYYKDIIGCRDNVFNGSGLKEELLSNISDDNFFVIITSKAMVIYPDISEIKEIANNNEEAYRDKILMYMIHSRINFDLIEYAKQELELKEKESTKVWDIYIFKKKTS